MPSMNSKPRSKKIPSRHQSSPPKKASAMGQIRIIGGQWRSRKLPIHDLEGLRPTTDRVRETLFNWLTGDLRGARVLDCFAGSGALTLESLSRYAAYGRAFELQKTAAMQLESNLVTLNCQDADIIHGDALALLAQGPQGQGTKVDKQSEKGFDIVFIDPPFRQGLASAALEALTMQPWLNANALIYIETEVEHPMLPTPSNWQLLKEKKAGQVCYRLYQAD